MTIEPIARGVVRSLAINGKPVRQIHFDLEGPRGDSHSGSRRKLSGHDGGYIRTSQLSKGSIVSNTRTWTALSTWDVKEVESMLGCSIPAGCLLENLIIDGIPLFSELKPTSRLTFPSRRIGDELTQAILAVWEENGPCEKVGARLERLYPDRPGLKTDFVRAAQHKRGNVGIVYSAGRVEVGDEVLVYPPVP